MGKTKLDRMLYDACRQVRMDDIIRLVRAGADMSQRDSYGFSIFSDVFCEYLQSPARGGENREKRFAAVEELLSAMVSMGWDMEEKLPMIFEQLIYEVKDAVSFDFFRSVLLPYIPAGSGSRYEKLLELLGTEESFQRCCTVDHSLENLLYALYELVEARLEGRSTEGMDAYHAAIGRRIDGVILTGSESCVEKAGERTFFEGGVGLVCGESMLLVEETVNLYLAPKPQQFEAFTSAPQLLGEDVPGSVIKDISFGHTSLRRNGKTYGRPVIGIMLDSGVRLIFSHNLGELEEACYRPYFRCEHG